MVVEEVLALHWYMTPWILRKNLSQNTAYKEWVQLSVKEVFGTRVGEMYFPQGSLLVHVHE